MDILLDALGVPGCFGRDENPDFVTFCVPADAKNRELP
jgi:hypothetical protein